MDSVTINITSIILVISGLSVISGSHIWVLFSGPLTHSSSLTMAASNIIACISTGVGFTLSQLNIRSTSAKLRLILENNINNI
jgi:hypothetical protein